MSEAIVPAIFVIALVMLIISRIRTMIKRDVNGFWRTMNSLQLEVINGAVVSRADADVLVDSHTCAQLQAHYDRYILNYEEDDRDYPWFQIIAATFALGGYIYVVFYR